LAAQALEATGDGAGATRAWRRLAVDEPDDAHAQEALAALGRLRAGLSPSEVLDRATELVRRARYTEALTALEGVPVAPRGPLGARRAHVLGRALYGLRTRYTEAHAALSEAGRREDNPDRDEDAFLAARSLARADRDDDAIAAFDAVARGRRGRWADEAAYRAAWLEAHHQRTGRALARLEAFLRERPEASSRLRVEAAWEEGWMLYLARRYPEAAVALDRAGAMATHHLERGRGRYWAAMARWRAGDLQGALRGWQGAIADRPLTYYALLSEARLRALGGAVPPVAPPPERRPTPAVELPARASWLRALGFDREAGGALLADEDALRARLPPERADEALAVAYLSVGEARRAFQLSSRHAELLDPLPTTASRWVWDCGFPRPHAEAVQAAEDDNGMPRQYLFAIMRQESAFNAEDVSSARAIGLLQMIPPTTRRVAQTLNIPFREELLFEPGYNIRVGGWYIGRLYRQYQAVLPRAIGSFNAGPGAMNRWIGQWDSDELDVFVERIPFDETRNYVKRVLQNLARYRYLHGPYGEAWPLRLSLAGGGTVETLVDY
ncbi:MAG: lytic transglycosylase domain-containing protein, partial [Deltaproteobacteria bacterium]|nr:lytic transglycosylase domain-containing protein [Deltaproteobacteria bacterium]